MKSAFLWSALYTDILAAAQIQSSVTELEGEIFFEFWSSQHGFEKS